MYKVSVVVPVYKTEKYLAKCIDSILAQTYNDFEIVLVDDGTPDCAGAICDEYACRNSNIHVIHQKNMGLAKARETGVRNARGEYIVFVDSDDWIEADMLQVMVNKAEQYGADCVSLQCQKINAEGKILTPEISFNEIVCDELKDSIYQMHVTERLAFSACGKLIKTEILKEVQFPTDLAIGEEHDMVVQVIWKAKRTVVLDNMLYNYFMRENSISKSGYNPKYAKSLLNYIAIERKIENTTPEYAMNIRAIYAQYEMAVVTAMCRNKQYDWGVIKRLKDELRISIKSICRSDNVAFYMKVSAILIAYVPRVFTVLFRMLHIMTGR